MNAVRMRAAVLAVILWGILAGSAAWAQIPVPKLGFAAQWSGNLSIDAMTVYELAGISITGSYYDQAVDMDPGPAVLHPDGTCGAYVSQFNPYGDLKWSRFYENLVCNDAKYFGDIAMDGQGSAYFGG